MSHAHTNNPTCTVSSNFKVLREGERHFKEVGKYLDWGALWSVPMLGNLPHRKPEILKFLGEVLLSNKLL